MIAFMNSVTATAVDFLTREGATILAGGTLLLAAGALATVIQRSPAARQRSAELTMAGVLAWLVLACVPLPRLDCSRWLAALDSVEAESVAPAVANGALVDVSSRRRIANDLDAVLAEVPSECLLDSSSQQRRDSANVDRDRIAATQLTVGTVSATTQTASASDGRTASTRVARARGACTVVYLIGAIGSLVWLSFGRWQLWRVLRVARRAEPWLVELFVSVASGRAPGRQVAAKRAPRLLVSPRCRRPFSCGLFRPAIVLPSSRCRPSQGECLRSVLLHELGHIRRRDTWGHQLFHLGLPLWFFHPLYWYLRWAAQLSRELIADDWAARHGSPEGYVRQLIALARDTGLGPAPAGVPAIFTSRTQFYRRMTMLIRRESPLATRCTLAWRSTALALVAVVVGLAACTMGLEPSAAQAPSNDVTGPDKVEQANPSAELPKAPAPELVVERDVVFVVEGDVVEADELPTVAEKPAQPSADRIGPTAGAIDRGPDDRAKDEKGALRRTVTARVRLGAADRQALEAELAQLEAQLQALRARLATLQAAEALPSARKTWDKSNKRLPETVDHVKDPTANGDPFVATTATVRDTAEAAVGGLRLDLVRLAEAYADAVGAVEIARARLEVAQAALAANPNAVAGDAKIQGPAVAQATLAADRSLAALFGEVKIQEITLRSAERKFASLRRIAEVVTGAAEEEAKSSEEDVERFRQLYSKGVITETQVRDAMRRHQTAQANVKTLRTILAE